MEYINTRAKRTVNVQGEIPLSMKSALLDRAREGGVSRSELVRALIDEARAATESHYLDLAVDTFDEPLVHATYTVYEYHQRWLRQLAQTLGITGSAALRIALATGWRAGALTPAA